MACRREADVVAPHGKTTLLFGTAGDFPNLRSKVTHEGTRVCPLVSIASRKMTAPLVSELMENALLAKLRDEDRERLAPHMLRTDLGAQDVLQRAGDDVVHTWFPCASATAAFEVWLNHDNPSVEVAIVGSEGAVGGIVSNGNVPAFATSRVQAGGHFLRIKTAAIEQCKLDSIALRHWFARYADCLIAQIFQTAACNATHTIVQRTAKWLLAGMARTGGIELEMTQEQLAETLGVGRTYVARVVGQLRVEGVIETRRGHFIVKDEKALRHRACNCTTTIEKHFDTVLHGIYPT
jgi:Crp-like helix-turn-helix protein